VNEEMPLEITLAAVGDILLPNSMIQSSYRSKQDLYDFEPIFRHVAPLLQQADLTIGNLEVPLAGRELKYTHKNNKSGFYTFNGPDELAPSLKQAGFDVLLTGNNHCMDRGIKGLMRTLDILDQHEIAHTGTFRSQAESELPLILNIQGIKIGILSYSKSTNKIPVPVGSRWCVNLIDEARILRDLKEVQSQVDLTVVCPHFGQEYRHAPILKQKNLVQRLYKHGANLILGAHPHVIQPACTAGRNQYGIYSLGNFLSTTLMNNPSTRNGVIMMIKIAKDDSGQIYISPPQYIPTWIRRRKGTKGISYEIIPIEDKVQISHAMGLTAKERNTMNLVAKHTRSIITNKSLLL
jgi:poly-gamma-glutamate capsule biosynthesis protein CapA/YwtB (metallophosphatase superfamily)